MNYLQQKKQAMISMKHSNIPSGYKRVEYLESTGTQWINTNIYKILSGYYAFVKFSSKSSKQYNTIFGAVSEYEFYTYNHEPFVWNSSGSGLVMFFCDGISGKDEIRNAKVGWTRTFNNQLQLFAYRSLYNFIGKLYSFSLYDQNDSLRVNLIPCIDQNNRPCMYDTVSRKTYYNQGTGEFLYGEVIK